LGVVCYEVRPNSGEGPNGQVKVEDRLNFSRAKGRLRERKVLKAKNIEDRAGGGPGKGGGGTRDVGLKNLHYPWEIEKPRPLSRCLRERRRTYLKE